MSRTETLGPENTKALLPLPSAEPARTYAAVMEAVRAFECSTSEGIAEVLK